MTPVHKSLVVLAATLAAPVAAGATPVRMQDFVTVQSQQSTTNYADTYVIRNGKVTLSKLAPAAASVAPVERGGVLHIASSAPAGAQSPDNAVDPAMSPPTGAGTHASGG
jgi:hypothetical protein